MILDLVMRAKRKAKRLVVKAITPKVRPAEEDFAMAVPFAYAPAPTAPKIAAVCHVFYPELAHEMRGVLERVPGVAIYISTDSELKAGQIRQAFAGWLGKLEIRVVENRGRDIAPKFVTFRDVYARYELILFLHSKKTAFTDIGDRWRSTLFASLAGSRETVASILEAFAADPKLGMVAPQAFEPIRDYLPWAENLRSGIRLARRMGIPLWRMRYLDFAAGSMFWARSAALQPLLALDLKLEDFPPEEGQINGTTAHAIERLMFYICEKAGYRWIKVGDARFYENRSTLLPIHNRQELLDFIARYRVSLR